MTMEAFVENPYIYTTQDAPSSKSLFCGRTKDVERIVECLRRNQSVALFGERRIGKTLLLYCLRDVTNDTEPSARPYQLIDARLDAQWSRLCQQLGAFHAVFVDIQDLPHQEQASEAFRRLIQKACEEVGFSVKSRKKLPSLVEFFERLGAELERRNEHLVVLVDEVEDLYRFKDSQQMLANLRSIIQAHSNRISFVLAGAEHWHQEVKYGSSPIANNLQQYCLRSPDSEDIRRFLITRPLSHVFGTATAERLAKDIIVRTGGKPWFIQMVCYFLWQCRERVGNRDFDRIWGLFLRDNVEEQAGSHLKNSYNRADENTRGIMKLLSVSELLSARQLAHRLGMPEGEVFRILADLEELDQVRSQEGLWGLGRTRYKLADKITREWWRERAANVPMPLRRVRIIARWASIAALLIASVVLYSYTHPRFSHHSVALSGCTVQVWYPSSVEVSEKGVVRVAVSNDEALSTAPMTVTVLLSAAFVDYGIDGSNLIQFIHLRPEEQRDSELHYLVHPSVPVSNIITKLTLALDEAATSSTFSTERRRLPVKQYWGILEFLAIGLAGLIARKEIVQLIEAASALVSGVGRSTGSS